MRGESVARFLYIVAREQPELYEHLYEQLRRDLETATVELMFDRRGAHQRERAESVGVERRVRDRRQHHIEEELTRFGWVRLQVE